VEIYRAHPYTAHVTKQKLYIPFLEFGTNPQFIPFAFGRNQIVYHPGSNKHLGFIRNKSSVTATEFIAKELNGKAVFYIND
jgi:hypothetical protein